MTVLAYFPSPPQGVWQLGPIPIRAYALFIIIGIVVAVWIGGRRWEERGGDRDFIYDAAVFAVIFGLVGGRLYHVMTDWPTYFGSGGAGFLAALKIWDGGLGIWGAVALGGVGAWTACRRRGIPLPALGDAIAPGIVLAQAIGRIGNFFNQELYGRDTTLPWGMEIFYRQDPTGVIDVHSLNGVSTGQVAQVVHPTFLYELIWNVLVFVVLIVIDRRFKMGHGRLFAMYVAGYCIGRFWIELLRSDEASLIAGIRINSFTATFVFIGAVVYIILAPKGREDPAALRGIDFDAEEAVAAESAAAPMAEQEDDAELTEWARELVRAAAGTGVVAGVVVAAEDEAREGDTLGEGGTSRETPPADDEEGGAAGSTPEPEAGVEAEATEESPGEDVPAAGDEAAAEGDEAAVPAGAEAEGAMDEAAGDVGAAGTPPGDVGAVEAEPLSAAETVDESAPRVDTQAGLAEPEDRQVQAAEAAAPPRGRARSALRGLWPRRRKPEPSDGLAAASLAGAAAPTEETTSVPDAAGAALEEPAFAMGEDEGEVSAEPFEVREAPAIEGAEEAVAEESAPGAVEAEADVVAEESAPGEVEAEAEEQVAEETAPEEVEAGGQVPVELDEPASSAELDQPVESAEGAATEHTEGGESTAAAIRAEDEEVRVEADSASGEPTPEGIVEESVEESPEDDASPPNDELAQVDGVGEAEPAVGSGDGQAGVDQEDPPPSSDATEPPPKGTD